MNLMSVVLAPPSLRSGHKAKPCTKKDAPAQQHGTWRKVSTSSKILINATFYSLTEARAMPAPTSKSPEEREFGRGTPDPSRRAPCHEARLQAHSTAQREIVQAVMERNCATLVWCTTRSTNQLHIETRRRLASSQTETS